MFSNRMGDGMKKILILMSFVGAIARLEASSQVAGESEKGASQHVPQSRSWVNDVRDSRSKEADYMTEAELQVLYQEQHQRRIDEGCPDSNDNQSSHDRSLQSQSEEESKSVHEEQVHESLIAQWQRFFMRIYASWCRK